MQTLREVAKAYEPQQGYRNIAELDKVNVDIEVQTDKATSSKGEEFEYYYFLDQEQKIRVPKSVIESLKILVDNLPTLQYFKVTKTGEGMGTKYSVIPLSS